jgi:hypothetical protein
MKSGQLSRAIVAVALAFSLGGIAAAQDVKKVAVGDVAPIAPDWPSCFAATASSPRSPTSATSPTPCSR